MSVGLVLENSSLLSFLRDVDSLSAQETCYDSAWFCLLVRMRLMIRRIDLMAGPSMPTTR